MVCLIYRTEYKAKRSEHFLKIHSYLQSICEESHLQGLKYCGGPEVKCRCKGPNSKPITKVLAFAEYNGEKPISRTKREVKCKKCFQVFKLEDVIDEQVSRFIVCRRCCMFYSDSF